MSKTVENASMEAGSVTARSKAILLTYNGHRRVSRKAIMLAKLCLANASIISSS